MTFPKSKPLGIVVAARGIEESIVSRFKQSIIDSSPSYDYQLNIISGQHVTEYYNKSRDLNDGIRELLDICDPIVQTDIDMLIPPKLIDTSMKLTKSHCPIWVPSRYITFDLGDTLDFPKWQNAEIHWGGQGSWNVLTSDDWKTVGGFDERCEGWGTEDYVLQNRYIQLDWEWLTLSDIPLVHVDHPNRSSWGRRQADLNLQLMQTPVPMNWITKEILHYQE